jgi:hypothetical protein
MRTIGDAIAEHLNRANGLTGWKSPTTWACGCRQEKGQRFGTLACAAHYEALRDLTAGTGGELGRIEGPKAQELPKAGARGRAVTMGDPEE